MDEESIEKTTKKPVIHIKFVFRLVPISVAHNVRGVRAYLPFRNILFWSRKMLECFVAHSRNAIFYGHTHTHTHTSHGWTQMDVENFTYEMTCKTCICMKYKYQTKMITVFWRIYPDGSERHIHVLHAEHWETKRNQQKTTQQPQGNYTFRRNKNAME